MFDQGVTLRRARRPPLSARCPSAASSRGAGSSRPDSRQEMRVNAISNGYPNYVSSCVSGSARVHGRRLAFPPDVWGLFPILASLRSSSPRKATRMSMPQRPSPRRSRAHSPLSGHLRAVTNTNVAPEASTTPGSWSGSMLLRLLVGRMGLMPVTGCRSLCVGWFWLLCRCRRFSTCRVGVRCRCLVGMACLLLTGGTLGFRVAARRGSLAAQARSSGRLIGTTGSGRIRRRLNADRA